MPDTQGLTAVPATLIPGDGIGPEITAAVVRVLEALGAPFASDRQEGGLAAVTAGGDPLATLRGGVRKRDLGGTASTEEFASAIIARLTVQDA